MEIFDTRTVVFAVAWLLLGGMMLLPVRSQSQAKPQSDIRAKRVERND
jgi:hypothetical protein